jgi:hypothetical protein
VRNVPLSRVAIGCRARTSCVGNLHQQFREGFQWYEIGNPDHVRFNFTTSTSEDRTQLREIRISTLPFLNLTSHESCSTVVCFRLISTGDREREVVYHTTTLGELRLNVLIYLADLLKLKPSTLAGEPNLSSGLHRRAWKRSAPYHPRTKPSTQTVESE